MAHTYKFRPDDTEDERDVRKMRSEYNRREDRKIERMLARQMVEDNHAQH